ncbi:50S ribosomal protein L36 [Proteus penneri]|nr:50S ribosomal protein L36 [Proteus penneri]
MSDCLEVTESKNEVRASVKKMCRNCKIVRLTVTCV